MVRMSRGNVNWTGVMIESSGLILTTARNLGPAPVADFLTAEGLSGEAWVVGRDDTNDVALLRVITPTGGIYATVALALTGAPQIDDELAALSFLAVPGAVLDKRLARVSGVREDPNTGIRYFQIQAVPQAGAEGGAVVDNTASLRGLRMTQAQMVEMGMSQHGEVYAMAVDALVNIVVPQLQAGLQNILPEASTEVNGEPGAPPDLPAVYSGSVSVGGAVPDSSLRVYAKVSKAGKPDLWFSQPLISATSYIMPLPIAIPGYDSATVEFWFDVRKANQVTTYLPGIITEVDLTFPAN
jgi:S1-C subfamily serine protease